VSLTWSAFDILRKPSSSVDVICMEEVGGGN